MKRIPLTKGFFAIVDDTDFDSLSQFKWHATRNRRTGNVYANTTIYKDRALTTSMHRMILGLKFGDKRTGDHRNHDTLDNRRSNLRIATDWQNKFNRGKTRKNKSGFKGVSWEKCCRKWRACIALPGPKRRTVHLGLFVNPKDASIAYQEALKKIAGEFACH